MNTLNEDRLSLWGRFMRRLVLDYMTPNKDGNLPDGGCIEIVRETLDEEERD